MTEQEVNTTEQANYKKDMSWGRKAEIGGILTVASGAFMGQAVAIIGSIGVGENTLVPIVIPVVVSGVLLRSGLKMIYSVASQAENNSQQSNENPETIVDFIH